MFLYEELSRRGDAMNQIKPRLGDRRKFSARPGVPFKDDDGVTLMECRRKIPDRRLYVIYYDRIKDNVIS